METLPDIQGATAKVKDTKELTTQVSPDLSESAHVWSISLTSSDLGGGNYYEDHRLYDRLCRFKTTERAIKLTIEFQEAEMDLEQSQMFPPEGEHPFDPDQLTEDQRQVSQDTADAEGEPRTYTVNGEEHEYGVVGTDADLTEGVVSPEQAEQDGAPEEFTAPPTGRRPRRAAAAEASE